MVKASLDLQLHQQLRDATVAVLREVRSCFEAARERGQSGWAILRGLVFAGAARKSGLEQALASGLRA